MTKWIHPNLLFTSYYQPVKFGCNRSSGSWGIACYVKIPMAGICLLKSKMATNGGHLGFYTMLKLTWNMYFMPMNHPAKFEEIQSGSCWDIASNVKSKMAAIGGHLGFYTMLKLTWNMYFWNIAFFKIIWLH